MKIKSMRLALAAAITAFAQSALATNGMNMEGYGAIATGMGGASMAYDNGAAAVMNNPATLGLAEDGNRLDVGLGLLGPNIASSAPGTPSAESSANTFYMPALGYVRNSGAWAYGFGVFAQGGMGTEYGANSFLAAGSGDLVRSEVGVGRFILPLSYELAPGVNLAGSLDYVWAGMDLKMALSGAQFFDMAPGGSQAYGSASGSMVNTFGGAFSGGMLTSLNWARFDFSNNNKYTGEAKGDGFAGKLGATFRLSDALTVGAAYHSKTALGDLETSNARVSMNVAGPATGGAPTTVNVTGKIQVRDFQWPQTLALGAALKVSKSLLLAADYKRIAWSSVMKDFKMSFSADQTQADPTASAFGLGGQSMDATMYQNWKDQNVLQLGAAFSLSKAVTLRGGVNVANNPVPDRYMNPLFPAIVKNHLMAGAGWSFGASSVDAALVYVPAVEATNGQGVTTKHSQTNAQLLYSYRF